MKKKILLVLTIVLLFVAINKVGADLTDYTGGSSSSLGGIGSGDWCDKCVGLKISIVSSSGETEDSEIFLNTESLSNPTYFSTDMNPKFNQTDNTIQWSTSVIRYTSNLIPSDWNTPSIINFSEFLGNSSYENLLLFLNAKDGNNKLFTTLSSGDYIVVEPMTKIGNYYGTPFELLSDFDDRADDANRTWKDGSFIWTYAKSVFSGNAVNTNGGIFWQTIYLNQAVLGMNLYNDTTSMKYDNRLDCLKNRTCGRGIGVYKYDDIFDPPEVEKFTLDLNYCVDGTINFDLHRYPTNFSYDFTLNDVNSSLTYHLNSVEAGTRYNISNIVAIGNDYEYKGYNVSTSGNCAVNNTSNNISGTVESFTSVNLVFETTCSGKLKNIKKSDGTYDPKDLFDLYKMYKDKGKDYRNLLNVSNPSCTTKDVSEKEVKNLTCLSASIEKDNFSEKNLSDYDEIVTDSSGNYIGFCSTTMNLANNLQTNKFYSKAGQFLVKQNSKSIQYDSTGGSETNVCGSSVSSANVQKSCYVLTGSTPSLNDFYKTDNSISVYFGDNDLNSQADKLPYSVKENSVTPANTTNSSLKLYNYEKKYNFGLNTVYLNKISGRASTSYIQDSTPIKGIISLFNSSSGTIPFKLIYDGKEYDSISCTYQTLPEITINNKLNLEFRSIDTNTPFGRTPNSNWNDGSGSNVDDNQLVQEHIINATNSYGMLNGEKQAPLYKIELSPEDIKAIREYNKVNAYDNYSVECETDMDGVVTCENTFLKGLENGYIKTKPEGGKQLNVSNKLVSNSDSILQYYNPADSDADSYASSNFEYRTCTFDEASLTPSECFVTKELSDGTIEISDYLCSDITDVVIPEEINDKKVTKLGEYAFYEKELTSVVIPDNVEIIDEEAFAHNYLLNVTISKNIKEIGKFAFNFNELTSVVIPDSIEIIGAGAFSYNNLTDVVIPNGITIIDDYTFEYNNLTSVVIPDSVQTIGYSAFESNDLTTVTIPNSVKTIDTGAFRYNELTSVTIPNSVTTINRFAFAHNKLTSVTIPNSVTTIGGGAFNDNQLSESEAYIYTRYSNGSINNNSLISYSGAKRTNIIIPNNVRIIDEFAFCETNITSVTIPNSVTTIGLRAFYRNKLSSIVIPSSVTIIDYEAFMDNNLASVTIPNSVTTIGYRAFADNELSSIVIPSSVKSMDQAVFYWNKLTSVIMQGKSNVSNFTRYPNSSPFGWANGYSDDNIIWQP